MEESVTAQLRVTPSALSLAYLGDAVIELEVRRYLLSLGDYRPGELVAMSQTFVTCEKQSDAVERLLPVLTEDELAVYKRGRNAKPRSSPKHGDRIQYKRATGMETLFGTLYLQGNTPRIRELFDIAFEIKSSTCSIKSQYGTNPSLPV